MLLVGKSYAFGWVLTHGNWVVFRKWLVISGLMVFCKARNAWLICDQKNLGAKETSGLYEIFIVNKPSIPPFVLCYAGRFALHEAD